MKPTDPHEVVRRLTLQKLTEPVPSQPGVVAPKEGKIAEWALLEIAEQLRGQNMILNGILTELRMRKS